VLKCTSSRGDKDKKRRGEHYVKSRDEHSPLRGESSRRNVDISTELKEWRGREDILTTFRGLTCGNTSSG
jgi:hypothetical protein